MSKKPKITSYFKQMSAHLCSCLQHIYERKEEKTLFSASSRNLDLVRIKKHVFESGMYFNFIIQVVWLCMRFLPD